MGGERVPSRNFLKRSHLESFFQDDNTAGNRGVTRALLSARPSKPSLYHNTRPKCPLSDLESSFQRLPPTRPWTTTRARLHVNRAIHQKSSSTQGLRIRRFNDLDLTSTSNLCQRR